MIKHLEGEIFAWTYRKSKKDVFGKMIRVSMNMFHRVPNTDINSNCGDNITHESMLY